MVVTIRFNRKEMAELDGYLQRNAYFDSLSSVGRVATMEFIRTRTAIALQPNVGRAAGKRPWFLWDYDITEEQAQEILSHAPFEQRKWLLARMLERLKPQELLHYVSLEVIEQALPHLRLDEKLKRHWKEAIELWMHPNSKF